MDYKWSVFNFIVKSEKNIIIKNMLNGAIVKLEKEVYENINKYVDDGLELKEDNKKIFKILKEQEIILNATCNEKKEYIDLLEKFVKEDKVLGVIISTTYGCNFKCPYCFESGIDRNKKFDLQDVNKISSYVEKYIKDNSYINKASITLFGGEPTLNWKFSEEIINELSKLFEKNNIDYSVSMTSNAFLLDDQKSKFLFEHNWKSVEITLDGPKKIHDIRRVLLNGNGTFDRIYKNIKNILEKKYLHSINLRINISEDNYTYIPELLNKLKNDFGTEKINISLGLITDTLQNTVAHNYISTVKITEENWSKTYIELYDLLNKLGFKTDDFYTLDGYCFAKERNSLIFCPDNKIYKCESMIGRKDCIEDDLINPSYNNNSYLNLNLIKKCLDEKCPFVPVCLAGCTFESLVKYSDINKRNCRRDMYTSINKEIIERVYKNA